MKIRNPKFETLNKFKIQNLNKKICLVFRLLGFRYCFGFRASDLEFFTKFINKALSEPISSCLCGNFYIL